MIYYKILRAISSSLSCCMIAYLSLSCGNSTQKNTAAVDSVSTDSLSYGTTEGDKYEGYTLQDNDNNTEVEDENAGQTSESSCSSSTDNTSNSYNEASQWTPNIVDGENTESPYTNYKETRFCVNGIVVYEGRNDYYIVRTGLSYTVLYRKSGSIHEGTKIRGDLKHWGTQYIINQNYDEEAEVYIEDYTLSEDEAYRWLGNHRYLKANDQELYDVEN